MPTSPAIDQLLLSVGKAARGVHQAQLDPQTRAALGRFGTFLINEGKSENTVRVYKSLCAKAIAQGADSNNPVMMSAVRALARFSASQARRMT
jgi:hypothetical protein